MEQAESVRSYIEKLLQENREPTQVKKPKLEVQNSNKIKIQYDTKSF